MEREKLTLTKREAQESIWGDLEGFKLVENKITSTSRWSIHYELVIQRELDGKYFRDYYTVGATEQQDEGPFEYDEPDFNEVFPVEKVIVDFE